MENIPNKVPLINQSSTPFGYQGGMSWDVSVEIKKKCHLDIVVCIHLGGIVFLFLKWLINLLIIRRNSLLIEVREALKTVGLR